MYFLSKIIILKSTMFFILDVRASKNQCKTITIKCIMSCTIYKSYNNVIYLLCFMQFTESTQQIILNLLKTKCILLIILVKIFTRIVKFIGQMYPRIYSLSG